MRAIGSSSAILLALLGIGIIAPLYIVYDQTEATTGTATQSTTTLTITNAVTSAIVDLSVTSANGTFAPSSSDISFGVKTTNYTGYTVSLAPKSGSTSLTNNIENETTSSYDSFATLSSSVSENDFGANTAAAGSSYNGLWGIKPSQYVSGNSTIDNSASNGTAVYLPASSITIDKTSASNATAKNYTVGIGARASYSQSAGTYSNTYVLTATGNAISYEITYDKNTTDSVTNMPYADNNYKQAGEPSATTIALSSLVPERDGYNFKGWCSVTPTDNDTSSPSCSGTTYNPDGDGTNLTYGIDYTSSNATTIHAMWEKAITIWGYIQDMTLSDCQVNVGLNGNASGVGDTLTVLDKRDENDYTVRWINNQCWMTQNLRVTGTIPGTYSNFSASSFNVSQYDLTNTARCNAGSSATQPLGYTNVCSKNSGDVTTGVWYNYAAASAGTITGYSNSNAAAEDICPSGWHLPAGPSTISGTDFNKLVGNMTSSWQNPTTGLSAFGAVAGGLYDNGQLSDAGYGFWWSQSVYNAQGRDSLGYKGSQFYGDNRDYRAVGYYVRCVKSTEGYMQDVTKAQVDTMSNGDLLSLEDKRDGKVYAVKKIDGYLIMAQNLDYIGGGNGSASAGAAVASNGTSFTMTSSTSSSYTEPYYYQSSNSNYGTYYNYCAASGNSVCTKSSTTGTTPATVSICPSGWKLPESLSSTSFGGISTSSLKSSGNLAVYAGYYSSGTLSGESSYGLWWSATAPPSYTNGRYYLYYSTSGNIGAQANYNRDNLLSVRCIFDASATISNATYMQGVTANMVANTAEGSTATLTDSRDSKTYAVKKINGQLWMTQNLRITGTISGTGSNFSAESFNVSQYDLTDTANCNAGNSSTPKGYTNACSRDSGDTAKGVWYNFAAASAGTITGYYNATIMTQDICPDGWHLPTGPSITSGTDFNKLMGDGIQQCTTEYWQPATAGLSAFGAITGGVYKDGSLSDTGYGFWWSKSANGGYVRYGLWYKGSSNQFCGDASDGRSRGNYVRCVRAS